MYHIVAWIVAIIIYLSIAGSMKKEFMADKKNRNTSELLVTVCTIFWFPLIIGFMIGAAVYGLCVIIRDIFSPIIYLFFGENK